jgi:copper(I)-binding protein
MRHKARRPLGPLTVRAALPAAFLAALVLLGATAACAGGQGNPSAATTAGASTTVGNVSVSDAWVTAAPVSGSAEAFLVIRNAGATAERFLAVQSPAADQVEIQGPAAAGQPGEVLPGGVQVPAGASVAFQPGGMRLALLDLTVPLDDGDMVTLVLFFETAGTVTLSVPVRQELATATPTASY